MQDALTSTGDFKMTRFLWTPTVTVRGVEISVFLPTLLIFWWA
jgi:hypothetical protein